MVSFSTNKNCDVCDYHSVLKRYCFTKCFILNEYKYHTWKWLFSSTSTHCYQLSAVPTHPRAHTRAHTQTHCRSTHAGLFLGHLPSFTELPAEFLVQMDVLPLSWNSNADAHEIALTAVKWSTINRGKKNNFHRRNKNVFSEYFSSELDMFLFKVNH